MFPIIDAYFFSYKMGGDFQEELVIAYIEKNIKQIVIEAQAYLDQYEEGDRSLFHVDIDNVLFKITENEKQ